MAKDNTIEEIKEILKEFTESQKKSHQKLDEEIAKLMESQKRTDEQLKKTDEEIANLSKEVENVNKIVKNLTDDSIELRAEIKSLSKEVKNVNKIVKNLTDDSIELRAEIKSLSKEVKNVNKMVEDLTDSRIEVRAEIKSLSAEVKNVNKMVGDLTDGWGKFVVGLTEPSITDEFERLGFKVLSIDSPPPRSLNGRKIEVDLLIISKLNSKPRVIAVEVKSSMNQKKLNRFIDVLREFKQFFFEYKDIELIGGVAAVRFAKGIKEWILENGLYLFSTSKGMMRSITPAGFIPKAW
jgi:peptidoglycan hydrolase CwlO-like protein